jgi:hypothetical protein
MKGIVLETKGSYASVMTEDGAFCKVRSHDYSIGEEIIIKNEGYSHSMLVRWGTGVAAVFAFLMITAFAYYTPTGYVSLDVNPSIEYSINMFDRVLDFKAVNEDAENLLGSVDFKNMHINKALEKTTAKLIEKGYITKDNDNDMYIATSGKNAKKAERLADQLEARVRKYIDQEDKTAEVEAEAIGLARVEQARALQEKLELLPNREEEPVKVTPGKLNLVQKLIDSTQNDIAISEEAENQMIMYWIDQPVKEIQSAIKGNGKPKAQVDQDNSDADDAKDKPGKGNSGEKADKKEDKKAAQQIRKDSKEAKQNNGKNDKEDSKSDLHDENEGTNDAEDQDHSDKPDDSH